MFDAKIDGGSGGETKTCKYCMSEIPKRAKICPNCLKKQGPKWWVTAIFVISFFGLAGALFGGEDESSHTDESEIQESENRLEEPLESEQSSEWGEEEDMDNVFYVGDVLETKQVRLSYLSCGDYSDGNMFVEAGEGNKLIYFEFEFENIGDTDTSVGSFDFDCYADGYESSQTYAATGDNVMTSVTTLSSGRKTKGIVVFEVPQDTESIEVEYETSYWTQDKAIFVYE